MKKSISGVFGHITMFLAYLSCLLFGQRKADVAKVAAPSASVYDAHTGKPLNEVAYEKATKMFNSAYYPRCADTELQENAFYIMSIDRVPMADIDGKKTMKVVVYLHNQEYDIELNLPRDRLSEYFVTKD